MIIVLSTPIEYSENLYTLYDRLHTTNINILNELFFCFLWKKKIYLLFLPSCPFSYFPSLYNLGLSNISWASSRLLLLYTAVSTDIFTKDTRTRLLCCMHSSSKDIYQKKWYIDQVPAPFLDIYLWLLLAAVIIQ